jgi:predicted DNA-binding protein
MRIPIKTKKRLEAVAKSHDISAAHYIRLALEIPLRTGTLPTYGDKHK